MARNPMLRWRAYGAVAVAVIVAAWWLWSGGPTHVIRVDYQWLGDMADGAQVVIDDSVVGVIQYNRNRPIQGFVVEPGERVVELRLEGCDAVPETVQVASSRIENVYADLSDSSRCAIFFRR